MLKSPGSLLVKTTRLIALALVVYFIAFTAQGSAQTETDLNTTVTTGGTLNITTGTLTVATPLSIQASGDVTVNGNGNTINGGGTSGFFVESGTLTITNANLNNFNTTGGTGSGGGAGLGGAIFVNAGATVTLNSVNFTQDSATGGLGGVGTIGGSLNNLFPSGPANGANGANGAASSPTSAATNGGNGGTGYNGAPGSNAVNGYGGSGGAGGDGSVGTVISADTIKAAADAAYDAAQAAADSANEAAEASKAAAETAAAAGDAAAATADGIAAGDFAAEAVTEGVGAAADAAAAADPFEAPVAIAQAADDAALAVEDGVEAGAETTDAAEDVVEDTSVTTEEVADMAEATADATKLSADAIKAAADATYLVAITITSAAQGTTGAGGDGGHGAQGASGTFGYGGGAGGNGGNGGDAAPISAALGGGGGDAGNGGSGGFGGGGGSGGNGGTGGTNASDAGLLGSETGAGGGGGSGGDSQINSAGFGGGTGSNGSSPGEDVGGMGGGGSADGGAIFIRDGGTVILTGNITFAGNSVTGGLSANGGQPGAGNGVDIFIMTGGNLTFAPGVGNTITVNGGISDDSLNSSGYATNNNNGYEALGAGANITISTGTTIINGGDSISGITLVTAGGVLQAQDGTGLSPNSNLDLDNGGIFESNGSFGRFLGTGGDLVQFTGTGGGFAASGGPLTVTLNNNQNLTWGTNSFVPLGASLYFGEPNATDSVTFTNNIDLNGATDSILVAANSGDSDTAILTGVLSDGALSVNDDAHTGTLILAAAETYTGGTTINNGTLALQGSGAQLYSLGSVVNNGNFDISGSANQTIGDLSGSNAAATVSLGQYTLATGGDNATTEYDGVIADGGLSGGTGGSLDKQGTGTFTLTNANTYTGGTTIDGGTLALAAGGSLYSGGHVQDNGQTFDISQASGPETIGDLAGSGTVNLGANELITGGDNASTLFSGTINDGGIDTNAGGSLDKQGTGTFTLTNANTYTGGTTIDGGTLALAAGGSLYSGGHVQDNGQTFDISQATGPTETIGDLNGSGTVDLGQNELITGGDNASTLFSGVIADGGIGGNTGGSLDKQGTGTFTLSGANTYTGGTTIDGGTLALLNAGSLYSNGHVQDNGYTFDISQASGPETIGDLAGSGTVNLGQNELITGGDNATTTFSGTINDNGIGGGTGGSLDKQGTGTFTLTGANSYTGGTTIDGGTLALALGGSLYSNGHVQDNGQTFDISQATGPTETIGDLNGSGTVNLGANDLATGGDNASTTFSGTINDGGIGLGTLGSLDKQGTGTFTLTGLNTYTGGTTIDGGTLALKGPGILYDLGTVQDDGYTFDISQATGTEVIGDLNGSGTVDLGANELASGGDNLGTLFSGVIEDGGLSGGTGGSLDKQGTGTFTLTGANTYTGGTTIDGGTLALSLGGSLYFNGHVQDNGSTFDISQASGAEVIGDLNGSGFVYLGANELITGGDEASTLFSGVIEDGGIGGNTGGSLDKQGSGVFTLTGANTYTGGTTIDNGTLALALGGSLYSGGTVQDNGSIFDISQASAAETIGDLNGSGMVYLGGNELFTGGDNATTLFSGVIADGGIGGGTLGSLDKQGTGTFTLTGANTYTGGTTIDGGTLALAEGGSLYDLGTVQDDGLTFDISQAYGAETIGDLRGSGTVNLGANELITGGDNASTTFSGTINDGGIGFGTLGSLDKQGTGTFTLTGVNTYTGGTTIDGGTLALSGAGILYDLGTVQDDGATFDISQATGPTETIGDLTGSGTVNLGANELITGGDNNSTLFTGVIADGGILNNTGGSLDKQGTGTFTLTGANTYTGGTTIDGGTLALALSGSLYDLGTVKNDGATFDISQASGAETIGDLTGSGMVNLGANELITGGDNATTLFSGTINDGGIENGGIGGGTLGSLDKQGTGTFTLTGANTYTGPTTISGGVLQLGSGGTTGSIASTLITDDGQLTVDRSNAYTISANIQGTGTFTQIGTGTTTLTGTDTYTGGTTISSGELQVGSGGSSGSIVGNILDDTTLVTDVTSTLPLAGNITGTGQFNQIGTGTVVLSGTNSFNGYTQTAGTTQVGSLHALGGGNVAINGGTLDFTTGTQSLSVGGNFTLGDTATLVDSIDIVAQTINVALNSSLTGTIQVILSNGFSPTGVTTYTIVTSGGTLSVMDARTLTLAPVISTNPLVSYVDAYFVVTGPALQITVTEQFAGGSETPALVKPETAAMLGEGAITPAVVTTGGTGTTKTAGVAAPAVVDPPSFLTPNQSAVVTPINEALTIPNDFDNPQFEALVTGLTNATASNATYANALDQLTDEAFARFVSQNQINNASFLVQNIDTYLDGKHGADGTFQSSYGIDSTGLTYGSQDMDPTLSQVQSRLLAWNPSPVSTGLLSDSSPALTAGPAVAPSAPANLWNVFVAGNAIFASQNSNADLSHADSTTGSVQVGADYRVGKNFVAGLLMGYGYTSAKLDTNGSKASVDSFTPGIYASYLQNNFYVNALACYGYNTFSEDRHVDFGGFSAVAHGDPNGSQELGDLDGGYDFHAGNLTFGPTLGAQFLHLHVDSFTESSGGIVDLANTAQDQNSLRSHLGGRVSGAFKVGGVGINPHLSANWQHEFLNQSDTINSSFEGLGVSSFATQLPNPSKDSALIDLGVDVDVNREITLFLDYLAQVGQDSYTGQSVEGGVKLGF